MTMTDDTTDTAWIKKATELLQRGALDALPDDDDAKLRRFRAFLRHLPAVSTEEAEKAGDGPANFLDQVADDEPPTAPYYVGSEE